LATEQRDDVLEGVLAPDRRARQRRQPQQVELNAIRLSCTARNTITAQ